MGRMMKGNPISLFCLFISLKFQIAENGGVIRWICFLALVGMEDIPDLREEILQKQYGNDG